MPEQRQNFSPSDTASEWRSASGLTLQEALAGAALVDERQKQWAAACEAAEWMGGTPSDFMHPLR